MNLDFLANRGCPLERQKFTWRDLVGKPISKLDDDAFTRIRVILMNGIESDALRLKHIVARFNRDLRLPLAEVRRAEHHQQTMVNWLLGADHSPLETTIGYEQVAVEVTSSVAQNEPDEYLAQTYRFGLLEDFDHLYRYSALLDRLEGKDSNNILQGYTDIIPGRPTADEHRAPQDDLREPFGRGAALITKINATMITAAEYQTHDYYMTIGPIFADPVARQLYAEIASIEEQHVTQYGSLIDPQQSPLEQWLIHECTEAYCYASCAEQETNPRIKAIWERFLDYELGHVALVCDLMQQHERRDPAEVIGNGDLPRLEFTSHRDFVRKVLAEEVDLRARGSQFVAKADESEASLAYREQLNSRGSPSTIAAAGYRWSPGTELARKVVNL
jgi:rubrerythrin